MLPLSSSVSRWAVSASRQVVVAPNKNSTPLGGRSPELEAEFRMGHSTAPLWVLVNVNYSVSVIAVLRNEAPRGEDTLRPRTLRGPASG